MLMSVSTGFEAGRWSAKEEEAALGAIRKSVDEQATLRAKETEEARAAWAAKEETEKAIAAARAAKKAESEQPKNDPTDLESETCRKVISEAIETVGPSSDWYQWARDEGMYISRDEFLQRVDAREDPLVIDVRDDDAAGGQIRLAVNLPDGTFNSASVVAVLRHVQSIAATRAFEACCMDPSDLEKANARTSGPVVVVLHCMESARRAPRCARRLSCAVTALRQLRGVSMGPTIEIRVLEGGFDQYCRRYWKDPYRVVGYDDEYWGYREMDGTQMLIDDEPAHKLYTRPADLPDTALSEAGQRAAGAAFVAAGAAAAGGSSSGPTQ